MGRTPTASPPTAKKPTPEWVRETTASTLTFLSDGGGAERRSPACWRPPAAGRTGRSRPLQRHGGGSGGGAFEDMHLQAQRRVRASVFFRRRCGPVLLPPATVSSPVLFGDQSRFGRATCDRSHLHSSSSSSHLAAGEAVLGLRNPPHPPHPFFFVCLLSG